MHVHNQSIANVEYPSDSNADNRLQDQRDRKMCVTLNRPAISDNGGRGKLSVS